MLLTRDLGADSLSYGQTMRPALWRRHPVLAGLCALCAMLVLALIPHFASPRGADGRVARCTQGLSIDADLRRTLGHVPPGQPLAEAQRTALALAVVTQVDDDDARFMFKTLISCLESDTAMALRGAEFAAHRAALTRVAGDAGFDHDTTLRITGTFDRIGPLYAHDAIFAARKAQRDLVDNLTTAVVARDGNALSPAAIPGQTAPGWLAADDLAVLCDAATGPGSAPEDRDLCEEAQVRLQRQRTPCALLSDLPALSSPACQQPNRTRLIADRADQRLQPLRLASARSSEAPK